MIELFSKTANILFKKYKSNTAFAKLVKPE